MAPSNAAALLVAGCLVLMSGCGRGTRPTVDVVEPPEELTFDLTSPYRNTSPEVRYVGDQACAGCHRKIHDSYRAHPMGRSAAPVAATLRDEQFGPKAETTFEANGLLLGVERHGDQLFHLGLSAPAGGKRLDELDMRAEVAVVFGSGKQGQSYFSNRGGYLFHSPTCWYSSRHAWGLSPGEAEAPSGFSRPMTLGCVFCHSSGGPPLPDTINRYERPLDCARAIGCERCHGPGALHVQARGEEGAGELPDTTIVNPKRLEPGLRDAVCEQCHLQGRQRVARRGRSFFDYRPGLPLHAFVSVFVLPSDEGRSVSHVEQMHASRCFQASRGKLGCTSCHDPHGVPADSERVRFYRDRCLACHQESSCSLPVAVRQEKDKADSCIGCHMPAGHSSNISHAAVTDHRVLRRPDRPPPPPPGPAALAHFHRDLVGREDAGLQRDLALAHVALGGVPGQPYQRPKVLREALAALEAATARHPDDVEALLAQARGLQMLDRKEEALAVVEQAVSVAPGRELVLLEAATLSGQLGRIEQGLNYWRRVLAINPQQPGYYTEQAKLLARRQDWPGAIASCRAALKLEPPYVPARMVLIACLAQSGDKAQARQEYEKLLALNPPGKEGLPRWFEGVMR